MVTTRPNQRRGGVYIAVLGVSAIVAAMGLGLLYTVRLEGAASTAVADTAAARLCAEAGVDAVAQYITSTGTWRTRAAGTWINGMALGSGTVSVDVTDPQDGNLANDSSQSIQITATGRKGGATHILKVLASPRGTASPCLSYAVVTGGQLHMVSGTLNVSSSTASTNGELRFETGTIIGNVRCSSTSGGGTVTGSTTTGASPLTLPAASVIDWYIARATPVTLSTTTVSRALLTPSFNSLGGGYNHDGVYVINASTDITIRSMRVNGTLIINNPGKKVTIEGPVLMQPTRSDFPALLVTGNLVYKNDSTLGLSEVTEGYNFNPLGAPYTGVTDSDTLDIYPARIDGLVHAAGTVEVANNALVNGCIIAGSTSSADAFRVSGSATISYQSSLASNPPIGYTTAGTPMLVAGTWQQVVLP